MPDKMGSLPNGTPNAKEAFEDITSAKQVDVKAAEQRILSSTEHLNDILSLISLVTVYAQVVMILMFRKQILRRPRRLQHP